MMEYSVYVYGGGKILWMIFNGIAMLFKSDSPYFTSVAKLTMGIGVLYVATQAVPRASIPIFFKSWFLPTFLLSALFFSPKTQVHIIDKANPDFQYSKVDNIPFGVAAVASLTTQISEYLTEHVETIFGVSDAEKFSKVGPMFGSRLIQAAHHLTIKDPLMRQNLKDFTRQCFAWPYVFSNLGPGKKAAMETEDMLGFIAAHPRTMLGIYWRENNGQTTFMNCKQAAAKVQSVIGLEVKQGFTSLAQKLFGVYIDPQKTTNRLNQYFGDAWGKLAKGSSDAAKVIQQELMLNAYREAIQDKRDELGMGRSEIEMAHLNAARGMAQQDSSFLVKAIMAGTWVPVLHTIIFALAMIYFTVISPMTFLPRGTILMVHWVKVMMYLATWPVLFAILNCIGQMFAAQAMESSMVGVGDGLNLLTQNGLADVANSAYLAVIGMQLSVPFLAWTLLWGGGYAFSQLASSLTQGQDSFAGKAGSEVVDGNVSFDTQSLHNRSVANAQIAQQQVGPSFSFGSRMDDGKMVTLHGAGGQVTLQEHQTNLGTNVAQNDAYSTMLGMQSMMMQQSSFQQSQQSQRHLQDGFNHLASVGTSLADNKGWTDTFGNSETANAQKSFSEAMRMAEDFRRDNNIDVGKAVRILTQVGMDAGAGKGKGGLFGSIGANFGAQGSWTTEAGDKDLLSKAKSSNIGRDFTENFSSGLRYLEDHKGNIGFSSQVQSLDQAQKSFSEATSYNDQSVASMNYSKQLGHQASEQRQKSLSTTSNLTDGVVEQLANREFYGNKEMAGQWLSRNPQAFQEEASRYLQNNQNSIQQKSVVSKQGLDSYYEQSAQKIDKIPSRHQVLNDQIDSQTRVLEKQGQNLDKQLFEEGIKTQENLSQTKNKIAIEQEPISKEKERKEQKFEDSKKKGLTEKTWERW